MWSLCDDRLVLSADDKHPSSPHMHAHLGRRRQQPGTFNSPLRLDVHHYTLGTEDHAQALQPWRLLSSGSKDYRYKRRHCHSYADAQIRQAACDNDAGTGTTRVTCTIKRDCENGLSMEPTDF